MPKFGQRSLDRLSTVDTRLQRLFNEVIKYWDCTVLEGIRTLERQRKLVAQGSSKTMNSKHLTGMAVDVAPYPVDWNDHERFIRFGLFVIGMAAGMGIPVRWGRDWDKDFDLNDQQFNDSPHFEIME